MFSKIEMAQLAKAKRSNGISLPIPILPFLSHQKLLFEINGVKYKPIPVFKFRDGNKFLLTLQEVSYKNHELTPHYSFFMESIKIGGCRYIDFHWSSKITRIMLREGTFR